MKHVIVGAGPAGIAAARSIRENDPSAEIVIISKDTNVHSRCMLHKFLGGERDEAGISFVPKDFFKSDKIAWICGVEGRSIDRDNKCVVLADGQRVSYDRLLVTTGANFFIPPVPGLREGKNVFGFRDLSDAQGMDRYVRLHAPKRVAVIGAGLVGLDAAYALMERGLLPTVIEMADRIMVLQLDSEGASIYQKLFEDAGGKFILSAKVVSVDLDKRGYAVAVNTDDGHKTPCDMIVVAAGVRPAGGIFQDSGIAMERTVGVDSHMRTSDECVYAAGDVAGLSGIWPSATKQGRVAGCNMVGAEREYDDCFALKNTINFFDYPGLSVGMVTPPDDTYEIATFRKGKIYKRFITKCGRLHGVILLGDISGGGIWQELIKREIPVSADRKPLWKLSYADFFGTDERADFHW